MFCVWYGEEYVGTDCLKPECIQLTKDYWCAVDMHFTPENSGVCENCGVSKEVYDERFKKRYLLDWL
jgi:hypothetical protein